MIESFAPLAGNDARVLILGSMPGRASLDAQQYYAYAHNGFWPIMAELVGFDLTADYSARCAALIEAGVAVWDVLKYCEREGSLDASIVENSIVANDFASFFEQHGRIRHVFFNGAKAEASYRRYVLPTLDGTASELPMMRLPSTSPAHAAMNLDNKREHWRAITNVLQGDP